MKKMIFTNGRGIRRCLAGLALIGLSLMAAAQPQKPATPAQQQQALEKAGNTEWYTTPAPSTETCPFNDHVKHHALFDWKTGSVSPAKVRHSGNYCLELTNANNILYTYSFSVTEVPPTNGAFDLLKGAITAISDIGTGAAATPAAKSAATPGGNPPPPPPPSNCALVQSDLDAATSKASDFAAALALIDPGKDSSGKTNSVPLATTLSKWPAIPKAFDAFESSVRTLVGELPTTPGDCDPKILSDAETIISNYGNVRSRYIDLVGLVNSEHVAHRTAEFDSGSGYDTVVTEMKGTAATTAAPQTFHMDAGVSALSSSAGFLITTLSARSYSSKSAPNPTDPTMNQNVLSVDGSGAARPALAALLNYNFPNFDKKQFGFAVSAGPVFDISSGKADTSKFGFFGGVSIRLSQWVYLTPGVHIGQFADFPQGYTHAGQVIPANSGTPTANTRYSARFAFAITFKIKDLNSPAASTTTKNTTPSTSGK